MNQTEDNKLKLTTVGAILAVVLCQHAALYLAAHRFGRIIAEEGLSLVLPTPIGLLVQRPWILAPTAIATTAWAAWAMSQRASFAQARLCVVALAALSVAFQFLSFMVFLMPWVGGLMGRIE